MSQFTAVADGPSNADETDQLFFDVVRAVADAADADPLDLPPLYDAVDPDSFDVLLSLPAELDGGESTEVASFTYWEYDVTVFGDGSVDLTER